MHPGFGAVHPGSGAVQPGTKFIRKSLPSPLGPTSQELLLFKWIETPKTARVLVKTLYYACKTGPKLNGSIRDG